MVDTITKNLEAAANKVVSQKHFWDFTDVTHQSEWNIAHHFANEVGNIYEEYDCDVDIVKIKPYGNKRPDIVLHKRGNHEDNFLIVEVKYRQDTDADIQKIHDLWFQPPISYKYAASIQINEAGITVTVFENPNK